MLPGKVNALLHMRKFRDKGNKVGAVRSFQLLESEGLGHLISTQLQRGANMVWIILKVIYGKVGKKSKLPSC